MANNILPSFLPGPNQPGPTPPPPLSPRHHQFPKPTLPKTVRPSPSLLLQISTRPKPNTLEKITLECHCFTFPYTATAVDSKKFLAKI